MYIYRFINAKITPRWRGVGGATKIAGREVGWKKRKQETKIMPTV